LDRKRGEERGRKKEGKERRGGEQWNCDEGRALIWIVGSIRGKGRTGLRG
jgi:hypothetical protein